MKRSGVAVVIAAMAVVACSGDVAPATPSPSRPSFIPQPAPTATPTATPTSSPSTAAATLIPTATSGPTETAAPPASASAAPPVSNAPGVCAEAELLFDPVLNELLLVNCTTYAGGPTTLTVWGWNGGAWRVVTSGPAPARVVGGAALDSDAEILVVYGGFVPEIDPCNQETWQWDGAADEWTNVATDQTPTACDHLKMIYDPGTQTSILVGGQDAGHAAVNE